MTGDGPQPVRLGRHADSAPAADVEPALLAAAADVADADVEDQVRFAAAWGAALPRPGEGLTTTRWELLAGVAAVDLGVARVLEPHVDALAILAEAGVPTPDGGSSWGVYAAEGPGTRLTARPAGRTWRLSGTKPWCSLAGRVTHALVTAWVDDDVRGLFAAPVAVGTSGVEVEPVDWAARGLAAITSGPVTFRDVPADPVGEPGWYLRRDGFAWGGMGVAAVWYGGAVGVARRLRRATRERPGDPLVLAQLGAVDQALAAARAVLAGAARAVDDGSAGGDVGQTLALQARGVVADAAERVLQGVDHALGPGPLTQEEAYARRVADLRVYVRQHHPLRDAAALGDRVRAASEGSDW